MLVCLDTCLPFLLHPQHPMQFLQAVVRKMGSEAILFACILAVLFTYTFLPLYASFFPRRVWMRLRLSCMVVGYLHG